MSNKHIAFQQQRQRLYGHLALARISNSPTVVSNVLAGAALAGAFASNNILSGSIAVVALAMVLFYTAGMYLNDLFDYTLDCHKRPERPLPQGFVSRSEATITALALLAGGSGLLWIIGPRPFLCGLLLIALIVCYDRWHKRNPLSPLLMALCRVMVYIIAFIASSTRQSLSSWPTLFVPACLLGIYVVGLTAIARMEGMSGSQAGRENWSSAVLLVPIVYIVYSLYGRQHLSLLTLLLALLCIAWVVYSLTLLYSPTQRQVGRCVRQLIAGIALIDALVLATTGSIFGVLLALGAFASTLLLHRFVRGT